MLYDIIYKRINTTKYEPSAIDVRVLSEFDNAIRKIPHIFNGTFDYSFQVSSVWKKVSHSLSLNFEVNKENLINIGFVLAEFELYLQSHNFVGNINYKKPLNTIVLNFGQTFEFVKNINSQFVSFNDLMSHSLNYNKSNKLIFSETNNNINISIDKKEIIVKNDKTNMLLINLGIATKYVELYLLRQKKVIKNISLLLNKNDNILIEYE